MTMRSGAIFGPYPLALAILGIGLALGCSDYEPARPPVEVQPSVLTITPSALSLMTGTVYPLTIDLRDSEGRAIPLTRVFWLTSAPEIAAADPQGRVHALATGTSTITARLGRLSAVITVTVQSSPGVVRSVRVTPSEPTLMLGDQVRLSAVPLDASGAVVQDVSTVWSSADPGIAEVAGDGLVTALADGMVRITAMAGGATGQAMVNVTSTPPASDAWPNEPSVFTRIVDQPWNALGGIWDLLWGTVRVVQDSTAPGSPPNVLQVDFPVGFIGSSAPGTEAVALPAVRQVYVGIWWMASDPWQGHPSNSNKIQYLFTGEDGSMAMIMYGSPGGPYELRVFPDWHGQWLTPNVGDGTISLGTWHRIEWLVVYGPSNDPPSGIVRWWLDGVLVGDYANVRLSNSPLIQYKLAPVWGGAETVVKLENDFFRYDHIRISGR